MNRAGHAVIAALFLAATAAMFILTGTYAFIYVAGEVVIAVALALGRGGVAEGAGLLITLLFTLTAAQTLLSFVIAAATAALFIYGGSSFSAEPWSRRGEGLVTTAGGKHAFVTVGEVARVSITALFVSIIASILSEAMPVRAANLVAFIFLLTAALFVIVVVSAYVTHR